MPVPEGKLRLGGMALRNGLLVHGPSHWAAAVRAEDGSVKVASGPKPRVTRFDGVPGVRGLVRLGEAFAVIPLVKQGLPQVTMAAVDGVALGGGFMLAIAQDLRIASDRARFALPEVTLGFNPAYGIARTLDVLGGGVARDLLLTGRTVRATDALRMGLVNRVVAPPTLEASALAWAEEIAKAPRAGLAATKAIVADIRAGLKGREPEAYGASLRTSPEAQARIQAFARRKREGG